jgi:HEAT repeat protein
MLLTILAIVGRSQQLPHDRLSVYEHAISVLVDDWDVNKHLRDAPIAQDMPYLDHQAKLNLLLAVARRMRSSTAGLAGNLIAGSDLREELDTYLRITYDLPAYRSVAAANAIIRQLRERNFILCLFGGESYGFIHRSFLEYLAAAEISRGSAESPPQSAERIVTVFKHHWDDPAWHEVLLLLTGLADRLGVRIVASLLSANSLWYLSADLALGHLILAARCLVEIRDPQDLSHAARLVTGEVTRVLELSEVIPNVYIRLGKWGDVVSEKISPTLTDVFANPRVAQSCVMQYREWFLTWGILLVRRSDTEWAAFLAARLYMILIARNADSADFLLAEAFNKSEQGGLDNVQEAAVRTLGQRWPEDDRVLAALKKLAAQTGSAQVACAAIDTLTSTPGSDPQIKLWLDETLRVTRHSGEVRAALIAAVAPGKSGDQSFAALLREWAYDEDPTVRLAAVQALGVACAGDTQAERILWDAVYTGQDEKPEVRAAAIRALANGWHGDPTMAGKLRKAAEHADEYSTRDAAFDAVSEGWKHDAQTLPWLYQLAADPEHRGKLGRDAISRLATDWRGEPSTRKWLLGQATSGVRTLIALGKAWPGDPAVGELLRAIAMDDQQGIDDGTKQSRSEWVLRDLGAGWRDDPMTFPLLRVAAMSDTSSKIREIALVALARGWQGDASTAALLHDAARTDPDDEVRWIAVWSLASGWHEDSETWSTLQAVAESDESTRVRIAALRAIALHRPVDPDVKRIIREATRPGTSDDVRFQALKIAIELWHADQETLPWLLVIADDELSEATDEDHFNTLRMAIFLALITWWPHESRVLPRLQKWATSSWWLVRDIAHFAIRNQRIEDTDSVKSGLAG